MIRVAAELASSRKIERSLIVKQIRLFSLSYAYFLLIYTLLHVY